MSETRFLRRRRNGLNFIYGLLHGGHAMHSLHAKNRTTFGAFYPHSSFFFDFYKKINCSYFAQLWLFPPNFRHVAYAGAGNNHNYTTFLPYLICLNALIGSFGYLTWVINEYRAPVQFGSCSERVGFLSFFLLKKWLKSKFSHTPVTNKLSVCYLKGKVV